MFQAFYLNIVLLFFLLIRSLTAQRKVIILLDTYQKSQLFADKRLTFRIISIAEDALKSVQVEKKTTKEKTKVVTHNDKEAEIP